MKKYVSMCVLFSVLVVSASEAQAALVAHWKLDELNPPIDPNNGPANVTGNTPDAVGSIPLDIVNGTGSVTLDTPAIGPGVTGGNSFAMSLAPGNRRIRTRHGTFYPQLYTPSFTVTAWNYSDLGADPNAASVRMAIFGTRSVPTSSAAEGFTLYRRTGDEYEARIGAATGGQSAMDTSGAPRVSVWEHVALSFDATTDLGGGTWEGTLTIYVNGVIKEQETRNYSPPTLATAPSSRNFYVGSNSSFLFEGKVDDVRFYNEAISQSEIIALLPEPTALSLLLLGAGMITTRRNRLV